MSAPTINRPSAPWVQLLMLRQFQLNCIASCAIEYPQLRPRFDALVAALDGADAAEDT